MPNNNVLQVNMIVVILPYLVPALSALLGQKVLCMCMFIDGKYSVALASSKEKKHIDSTLEYSAQGLNSR